MRRRNAVQITPVDNEKVTLHPDSSSPNVSSPSNKVKSLGRRGKEKKKRERKSTGVNWEMLIYILWYNPKKVFPGPPKKGNACISL